MRSRSEISLEQERDDDDEDVRLTALAALGRLGDTAAVADLRQCLRDDDWKVLEDAATALGTGFRPTARLAKVCMIAGIGAASGSGALVFSSREKISRVFLRNAAAVWRCASVRLAAPRAGRNLMPHRTFICLNSA